LSVKEEIRPVLMKKKWLGRWRRIVEATDIHRIGFKV